MSVDPAMRSVRVAVALSDRFGELLKGPATVSARKQSGALLGVSGDDEGLSLRIGEAQQLYPEIWRHLDDARAAFAAQGIDVTAFDGIRATEGQALGAAVDVSHTRHGVGKYAVDENIKSANFNQAGLVRARAAIESLVRATPHIDWAAIARAEAEDPAVAAFGRATRTRRWIMFALLALGIASPFLYIIHLQNEEKDKIAARREPYEPAVVPALGAQEHGELANQVAQLRQTLSAARKSWALAVTPNALAIGPGTQPCGTPFEAPPQAAADQFIRDGNADGLGTATFATYAAGEPIRDDQLARMAAIVDGIGARLAANRADANDHKRLTELVPSFVFLIIDEDVRPAVTATAPKLAYTPGKVTGRAFVFSVQSGQIVCAGNIEARNTPSDASPYFDGTKSIPDDGKRAAIAAILHRELEIRIRQALASDLHATGP